MAHGALTPIIGLRLLALAAGLRHNAEIGQPGLCFSAYGHKFGINHLVGLGANRRRAGRVMELDSIGRGRTRWEWNRDRIATTPGHGLRRVRSNTPSSPT